MKTKYNTIIIVALSLLTLMTSCKHEEDLVIGEPINMLRFKFPQGNSPEDQKIAAIAKKFDSYIIYKDFDGSDIAKSWLPVPSGKVYLTTPTGDEGVADMMKMLEENILSIMSDKLAKKALPLYIYLCDSLASAQQGYSEEGDLILTGKKDIPFSMSGQDYWAFKLTPSERENLGDMATYGYVLRLALFDKLENNGHIVVPSEFETLSDYETPTKSRPTTDPNYYKNRGFIDIVKDSFKGKPKKFMLYLTKRGRNADFVMFVKALIFYTPEEFEKLYPKENYPLIHQKMDYVKETLLSQGLDLGRKDIG